MEELTTFVDMGYELFFQKNNSAMLIIDSNEYTIIDANIAAQNFFNLKKSEICGLSFLDFCPDVRNIAIENINTCLVSDNHNFRLSLSVKNSKRIIEFNSTVFTKNQNKFIHLILHDISEKCAKENEYFRKITILSQIINTVPQGIFWKDVNSKYLGFNRIFKDIVGLNEDEITNKDDHEIPICQSNADFYINEDKSIIDSKQPKYRILKNLTKNGEERIFETTKLPLIDDEGIAFGILGVMEDITQRKRLEEQLILNERRLSDALAATSDGFWEWNYKTGSTFFSRRWYEMVGYDDNEFDMNFEEWKKLVHPDDFKVIVLEINHVIKELNSKGFDIQFRMKHKNNNWIWIQSRGNVVKTDIDGKAELLSGTHTDITDRKKIEDALKESEETFRNIFNNAPIGIYRTQKDGTILMANPKLIEMLGFDNFEELQKRDIEKEGYENRSVRKQFIEKIEKYDEIKNFEERWKKKDGTYIYVNEYAKTVKDPIGNILYYEGTVEDVTEKKNAYDSLLKSEERFKVLSSMASEGIMIHKDGVILDANQAFVTMTNNESIDKIIGKNGLDVTPFDSFSKSQIIKRLQSDFEIPFDIRLELADGKYLIAETRSTEINYLGENVRLVYMKDITDRKLSEEALLLSQRMTRAILDQTFQFIGMLDINGTLLDANLSAIEFTGIPKEQIIGKPFWETPWWNFSDESVQTIKQAIQRAASGETVSFETFHFSKFNEKHYFDFSVKPVYDNDGQIIFLVPEGHDITDKKTTLELLKENELYYRTLFESANDAIFIMNKDIFTDCNKKVLEMFGCERDEIIGKSPYDFSPDYQSNGILSATLASKRIIKALDGYPQFFEWTHKKKNNQLFDAEVSLNRVEKKGIYEIQAIVRDITERKNFERELIERENDFKNLFEFSPLPIMMTDMDGKFIRVNKAFCEESNVSYHDVIGKSSSEINVLIDKKINEFIIRQLSNHGEVKNLDITTSTRQGIQKNLLLSSKILEHKDQKIILSSTVDITEKKRIENELTEYKNKLEVLVKNRTKQLETVNKELEAFSYSVSHDLRAPLRSIDGFSNALIEDYYDKIDDEGKDFLFRIRRAAKSMAQLIDSLLSLSRLSKSELIYDRINLSGLSESILKNISDNDKDRQKKFLVEKNLIIEADYKLIEILLTNLIENAWKFTKNKVISIIEIGKKTINDKDYFFVKDNGAGFDMTFQNKLFKPFQRLHSNDEFEGTGIGLATVKRIINRHNGNIWAESNLNEGTTFYFSINDSEGNYGS